MDCTKLAKNDVSSSDILQYLAEVDAAAIAARLSKNLHDTAKKATSLQEMEFSTFVKMRLIEELKNGL